jgi:ABC-2 type transport system permease protein
MSKPWLVIARREFLERVRTKWFMIGTLLGPIGMVALIVIPAVLARTGPDSVRIKLVDHTGRLAPVVEQTLELQRGWQVENVPVGPDVLPDGKPGPSSNDGLLVDIRDDKIDGFVMIPADALDQGLITYKGDNATNQEVVITILRSLQGAVTRVRATDAKVTEDQLAVVLMPVNIDIEQNMGEAKGSSGAAAFIVGYAVMLILYMAIVLYAMNVMRSVVQEKTSRVVELMVAAAKPSALMGGKILGVGAVGLVQLSVWLGMAYLTMEYRESVLGAFGVDGAGGFALPTLHPQEIAVVLVYFVLGYFFYASLYAAVGAMVSTEQEAQQAQTPVILLLIIPMTCMQLVANDPRGSTAELMTMLPFSSPILMPMRFLLGGASGLQVAISLGILMVSTAAVVVVAARIYRVGILMYGKRPSLRELVRWLRY